MTERTIPIGQPRNRDEREPNGVSTRRYNWLSFFPLSLLFQFRKASNCYFLFMVVLVLIPGIAPVSSYSTILPLLFVLAVSELRELAEELGAAKRDKQVNSALVDLLTGQRKKCAQLAPGDLVLLKNNDRIPADLLVMQTSHSDRSSMFVETASLDGETNLKLRRALPMTADRPLAELDAGFTLVCGLPNVDMYDFDGTLVAADHAAPLGLQNVVWRGCTLRNTEWIVGAVVYAGHDTKMLMNARSGLTPSKSTSVESQMNRNVVLIVLLQIVLCIVCASVGTADFSPLPWYLSGVSGSNWASLFFTFFVLLGNLIPVSLWVSVELLKVAQAFMMDADASVSIKCNSKNIHEELGQITHVFTDKTGTLTVNKMKFVGCNVAAKRYLLPNIEDEIPQIPVLPFAGVLPPSEALMKILRVAGPNEQSLFSGLAICHSCERVVEPITGQILNQSASPDEAALVSAAADAGAVFLGRPSADLIDVSISGSTVQFRILHTVAFTSERRMMTTVVECPDGSVRIITKGADSSVIPRCVDGPLSDTGRAVAAFSLHGYRTLCVAERRLSRAEWDTLPESEIETDLTIIGSTAVEDRLQDGAAETLRALKSAGIKISMITGDKRETAINIARSCGLISSKANVHVMLGGREDDEIVGAGAFVPLSCLEDIARDTWAMNETSRGFWVPEVEELGIDNTNHGLETENTCESVLPEGNLLGRAKIDTDNLFSLVIDGKCLKSILASESGTRQLVDVLSFDKCEAVVFCRVSPKQKGDIVRLVKKGLISDFSSNKSTLAIGDGANDINMINIANVGVGISGNEGAQAANSADYAIAEFKDLYTLLMVHGRWNYRRTSRFISLFLYKNFAFTLCQFWFAIMSGFSGQTVSESSYLLLFNSVFGIIPLFILGTLDKDVDPVNDGPEKRPFHNACVTSSYWREIVVPRLYFFEKKFNTKNVSKWCFLGLIHSVIVFFGTWTIWLGSMSAINSTGFTASLWMASILIYTVEIFLVSCMTLWMCSTWTKLLVWCTLIFNIFAYFAFVSIYDLMRLSGSSFVWYFAESTLLNGQFWLILAIVLSLTMAPLIAFTNIIKFYPKWMSLADVIQVMKANGKQVFDKVSPFCEA